MFAEQLLAACNAVDLGSIRGSGKSPGEVNGNPLQDSCWENPWTEEPGGSTAHGLQSRTQLRRLSTHYPPGTAFGSEDLVGAAPAGIPVLT